jgi:uracil-DNA glycosylase family 4
MSWTERQRRMLGAMGVRLWAPTASTIAGPPAAAPAAALAVDAAVAERPAATPASTTARASASLQAAPSPIALPAGHAIIDDTPPTARPPVADAPPSLRPSVADTPHVVPAPAARVATPVANARPTTLATAASAMQAALADPLLVERAAAIATLEWQPLKDAVAACTACGLCASRKQTVFGVGHAHADWMIVGEAPGEQEDLAGEPFVGPAGQLLDQMLRAVGQSRRVAGADADASLDDQAGDPQRRVFIANTLKCRPPRNRNPEPDEMARCEPFLQRQVALVKPKLLLAMGRFAVKQLLKSDDAIGKLRGRVHRYEGIPVVVTYHPAYLLRNLPDKAKAWEDLCLAKATIEAARSAA